MRKFRVMHKLTESQPVTGRHILQWGFRIGYWPCLQGYFLAVYVSKHRFYVWHGTESYNVA